MIQVLEFCSNLFAICTVNPAGLNHCTTQPSSIAYTPHESHQLAVVTLQAACRHPIGCLQTAYRQPTDCLQAAYTLSSVYRLPVDSLWAANKQLLQVVIHKQNVLHLFSGWSVSFAFLAYVKTEYKLLLVFLYLTNQ